MIELVVEDYCQECKAFSPVATCVEYGDRITVDDDFVGRIIPGHVHTTVKCENAKRCAGLARHIRNELNKTIENEESNNDERP